MLIAQYYVGNDIETLNYYDTWHKTILNSGLKNVKFARAKISFYFIYIFVIFITTFRPLLRTYAKWSQILIILA